MHAALPLVLLFPLLSVLALTAAPLAAQEAPPQGAGLNRYLAGPTLQIREPVSGSLFAAGGNVRLDAPVARDVNIAGGQVRIEAAVQRHLRVAGGDVTIGPGASVGGNLSAAGGQVALRAPVQGSLRIAGGRVLIDSAVRGDVDVASGQVSLGPDARIDGRLRLRSGAPIDRHPQAVVAGGVDSTMSPGPPPGTTSASGPPREAVGHRPMSVAWWLWGLGSVVLAAALAAVVPLPAATRFASIWRERLGVNLLVGLALTIGVLVAALLLFVTLLGVPFSLLLLLSFVLLLPVAYAATAAALGLWALQRLRPASVGRAGWRAIAAALAAGGLALLFAVPWLGGLLVMALLIAGLGALVGFVRAPRQA